MASHVLARTICVALFLAAVASAVGSNDGLCGLTQTELYECKPAVATGTSTPPEPTQDCCDALKHADVPCFCGFKKNKYLAVFGINATRAMLLPSRCDPTQTVHC